MENLNIIDSKVDALPNVTEVNAGVDQALVDYDGATKGELDSAHAITNDKVDALDAKIVVIDTKVGSLDTPPMVS